MMFIFYFFFFFVTKFYGIYSQNLEKIKQIPQKLCLNYVFGTLFNLANRLFFVVAFLFFLKQQRNKISLTNFYIKINRKKKKVRTHPNWEWRTIATGLDHLAGSSNQEEMRPMEGSLVVFSILMSGFFSSKKKTAIALFL